MVGEYKNRITVNRYGATRTASGGLQSSLEATWTKWAKIERRSGSVQTSNGQKEWSYDYRITVRYQPSQVERSNDFVIYDGIKMLVREVSFNEVGQKREVELRCSFIEQQTTVEALNAPDMITWYVTDGTEGNSLLMNGENGRLNLAGKTVTEVNVDNEELEPVADSPGIREFVWDQAARTITIAYDFGEGQKVKITYR